MSNTNKLSEIEVTLRKIMIRLDSYRAANDSTSAELDVLVDLIGEQADQISMIAMPISIVSLDN